MKVLLIGNYKSDKQRSMQKYAEMLSRELRLLGIDVRNIFPKAYLFPTFDHRTGLWKLVGYINKFILFPIQLIRHRKWPDVIHICDHSNSMYVPFVFGKANVVTCHDVIAIQAARDMIPGWEVRLTGKIFQKLILAGLKRAKHIVCVSDLTRNHLLALAPNSETRCTVIYNGLNEPYQRIDEKIADDLLKCLNIAADTEFFLHVGSDLPRKNRVGVISIFAELVRRKPEFNHKLIFVGPQLNGDQLVLVQNHCLADRVVVFSGLGFEQLNALYSRATALFFPSLNEGFGWPVVEAQACGCPVFTSNKEPMVEIGGDAARYIDPHDPGKSVDLILEAWSELKLMSQAGLVNASRFSASAMAKSFLDVYRSILMT